MYYVTTSLCLSNALNLNDSTISWRNRLQARTSGHWLRKEIDIHLIHRSKILHVRKIDIVLDNLVQRRSSKLKNLLEILQNSSLERKSTVSNA